MTERQRRREWERDGAHLAQNCGCGFFCKWSWLEPLRILRSQTLEGRKQAKETSCRKEGTSVSVTSDVTEDDNGKEDISLESGDRSPGNKDLESTPTPPQLADLVLIKQSSPVTRQEALAVFTQWILEMVQTSDVCVLLEVQQTKFHSTAQG